MQLSEPFGEKTLKENNFLAAFCYCSDLNANQCYLPLLNKP